VLKSNEVYLSFKIRESLRKARGEMQSDALPLRRQVNPLDKIKERCILLPCSSQITRALKRSIHELPAGFTLQAKQITEVVNS
jgi:hypothetical protein